jgi:protein-disulfide isomerase
VAFACAAWGFGQANVSGRGAGEAAALASAAEKPIAIVEGQPIYRSDLAGPAAAQMLQIHQQEYKIESAALDALINQKVVEAEAKKKGLTVEQLYQKEVDSKVPEPSDAEAKGYYLAVKGQSTLPFTMVEPQIKRLIKNAEIQQAREKYAEALRAKLNVIVYLQPPTVETGENDPARVEGNPKAPITIVEFGDFQCPFCGRVEPTLMALLKKYKGKVNLAFRDFPLSTIHPYAEEAAEAGRCAEAQGKFWPMHDAMYADQSELTEADLIKTATKLGMNEKSFTACLKSNEYASAIQQDVAAGTRAGVTGTPTFFINGRFLSGAVPEEQFEQIIDSELAALKNRNRTVASR